MIKKKEPAGLSGIFLSSIIDSFRQGTYDMLTNRIDSVLVGQAAVLLTEQWQSALV
jgi:hypothetical protein